MAHQAHNIPWNLLASNFEYRFADISHNGITNLYPRFRPNQGKELNHFVVAFGRTLIEHVEIECKKYPVYEATNPEHVVLSDQVVRKIKPTIHRVRRSYQNRKKTRTVDDVFVPDRPCKQHNIPEKCTCPLSLEDRKMKAFLHPWKQNPCYHFWDYNEAAFLGLETVKALLLYGEMDALLRICSHPEVDYAKCWSKAACYDTSYTLGWDRVCELALASYMCLNIMYCYPNLWDEASGRTSEMDYRWTGAYQKILKKCTESVAESNMPSFPHRQFYGISDNQFREYSRPRELERWGKMGNTYEFSNHYPYGILSIDRFLELEQIVGYQPTLSDVEQVRLQFTSKGLPAEIVLSIMEFADYTYQRRLPLPHDPLHPQNSKELRAYLTYCWKIMVRCGVMAKALGTFINWEKMVTACIADLWGVVHDYSFYTPQSDMMEISWGEHEPGINGQDGNMITFI